MTLILATELPGAGGGLHAAAALAVALAAESAEAGAASVMVEVGGQRSRGATMLASRGARELEERLRAAGLGAAARGRLCWLRLPAHDAAVEELERVVTAVEPATTVVAYMPPALWRRALESERLEAGSALVRAELPRHRSLAALLVRELRDAGMGIRVAARAPGRIAARRAIAGIDPGGETERRIRRLARALGTSRARSLVTPRRGELGQALPLALGGAFVLVFVTLALAALGGAVTGKSRAQRAADLVALSAARSMRDDFGRLFMPARMPSGALNRAHLSKDDYLRRARSAALEAAARNDVARARVRISFPDGGSFAPLRVRAEVEAAHDLPGRITGRAVSVHAEAAAVPQPAASPDLPPGAAAIATGGGYGGPLAYRQGEPMRPDVAAAFDRLAAAAAAGGVTLIVNSGFRSDAEQAALWAENPDPRWVAPPGTSLHRCATELDLGPPAAYTWLAANARRFGFLKRYSWEPWHFGYVEGPPPCSAQGDRPGIGASGAESPPPLPAFVPGRFRAAIARAAGRWNVPAALLAAQLLAESNFNPLAVSSAGAQGIAQFMPATAAAYGLDDPFDAAAAIDAQAHLMADLLRDFDGQTALALAAYNAGPGAVAACGCIPPYPETQAYVARILGLLDGAGVIASAPVLEVRLVD